MSSDDLLKRLDKRKAFGMFPGDSRWMMLSDFDTDCTEAAARIRELEARVKWRPIESAPKDGTAVLVKGGTHGCDLSGHEFGGVPFKDVALAEWSHHAWRISGGFGLDFYDPTRWMPLPKPEETE